MKIGTKSILFGAHCFFLHPFFVARAWWHLFGFPTDWRLWICFFFHDLGYWGCPNMDGPEGEEHPFYGAVWAGGVIGAFESDDDWREATSTKWYNFCLYHSRFYAKKYGQDISKLCYADKLSVTFMPAWWYVPACMLTGEIWEYMVTSKSSTYNPWIWFRDLQAYMKGWVAETMITGQDAHQDSREFHSRMF